MFGLISKIKQVSVRMVTSFRAWLRSEVKVHFHVMFRVRARGTRSENSSLVHTARPSTRPPAGKDSAPLEAKQHTPKPSPGCGAAAGVSPAGRGGAVAVSS